MTVNRKSGINFFSSSLNKSSFFKPFCFSFDEFFSDNLRLFRIVYGSVRAISHEMVQQFSCPHKFSPSKSFNL